MSESAQRLPILLFDGDCGFCTRSARWGQERFGLDHVEPWQAVDLEDYGVTEEACRQAVQWVDEDGTVSAGYKAVAAVLARGGVIARSVGRFATLPGVSFVSDGMYRGVARIRHRLPGSTEACRLPSAP